jgi:hypothetical protein
VSKIITCARNRCLKWTPYDPNLANEDIGIAIIWEKTLAAGDSITLNYIQSYGTPDDILVPEPGTFALLGAGVLGMFEIRRRKQA